MGGGIICNNGNNFRHALAEYIRGWGEGLAVEEEKYIGWRFIGTPRKLDIVIMNPQNCRSMPSRPSSRRPAVRLSRS